MGKQQIDMISTNIIPWVKMESVRTIRAFRIADWQMMIIPSLQKKAYHVIIDRAGENGLLVNRLMSKEDILYAYGIKL